MPSKKAAIVGEPCAELSFPIRVVEQGELFIKGEYGMVAEVLYGEFWGELAACPAFIEADVVRGEGFRWGFAQGGNGTQVHFEEGLNLVGVLHA